MLVYQLSLRRLPDIMAVIGCKRLVYDYELRSCISYYWFCNTKITLVIKCRAGAAGTGTKRVTIIFFMALSWM